jgi:hypothetical protein
MFAVSVGAMGLSDALIEPADLGLRRIQLCHNRLTGYKDCNRIERMFNRLK